MTVLVDTPLWPKHGTVWAHLVSDESIEELHAFALRTGLPSRSFDLDHYDIPAERYDELIAAGAAAVLSAAVETRRLRERPSPAFFGAGSASSTESRRTSASGTRVGGVRSTGGTGRSRSGNGRAGSAAGAASSVATEGDDSAAPCSCVTRR